MPLPATAADILLFPGPRRQKPSATVVRHLENARIALQETHLLAEGEAVGIIGAAFIDWAAPHILTDINPEASAREFCRELLSGLSAARRAAAENAA